jgi:hypothetical protein
MVKMMFLLNMSSRRAAKSPSDGSNVKADATNTVASLSTWYAAFLARQ